MIDLGEPKSIRFNPTDQPELAEICQEVINREREEQRRQKEETLRWLEEHLNWTPFGDVW